jgi:hypothetical protein
VNLNLNPSEEPNMENEFDYAKGMRRPRLWRDFKKLFGPGFRVDQLAARLEELARARPADVDQYEACYGTRPWVMLAVALHYFCTRSRWDRRTAMEHYSRWLDADKPGATPPAPPAQDPAFDALPADLAALASKLFGDDWRAAA